MLDRINLFSRKASGPKHSYNELLLAEPDEKTSLVTNTNRKNKSVPELVVKLSDMSDEAIDRILSDYDQKFLIEFVTKNVSGGLITDYLPHIAKRIDHPIIFDLIKAKINVRTINKIKHKINPDAQNEQSQTFLFMIPEPD